MTLPDIIVHADWGTSPEKRWMVKTTVTGGVYQIGSLECVADLQKFVAWICRECANGKRIMLGFDFPIGLPAAYAKKAGIESFRAELPSFGTGRWKNFFEVAQAPSQISTGRPFYPARPGKTKQQYLLDALGLDCIDQLQRRCDLPQPGRNAACPLFWTLGANQVGKGAIVGWRDVLQQLVQALNEKVRIWPFDGSLEKLIEAPGVVIVETYPTEFYGHLGVALGEGGKRSQKGRQNAAPAMIQWVGKTGVDITQLRSTIEDGFGTDRDGEDRFDAVVGALGMLNVILGHRQSGEPSEEAVGKIEGWILGQASDVPFNR
jgi:hypothetical protein